MPESREGAIPPELYSSVILASGSIYQASRTLEKTIDAYYGVPSYQRNVTLQVLSNQVTSILKNRAVIDVQFEKRFGKRLFTATTDDGIAIIDISTPCNSEPDFIHKAQALSGLVTRTRSNLQSLIRPPRSQELEGSINILKAILDEEFGVDAYDRTIIDNLRKINTLRSQAYPTHVLQPSFIQTIEDLGFTYPPDDWRPVWDAVLSLCAETFNRLMDLFRTRPRMH